MPGDASLSTKDLFLLLVGLCTLKAPPRTAESGKEYFLDKKSLNEPDWKLRESDWNLAWLLSPEYAWSQVPYRDWLMSEIIGNLAGHQHEFVAISEPMLASLDVLTNEFKPDMAKATPAIKQILESKAGYQRSFLTTLTVGLSKQKSHGDEVFVLGAGIRRRTRVWLRDSEAQADVEFFMPFAVLPEKDQRKDDSFPGARSICAGIKIAGPDLKPLWTDGDGKEIDAVRFNVRIPFTARVSERYHRNDSELETRFGDPVIEVQKRKWVKGGSELMQWEEFDEWKDFVDDFCESDAGGELLNAPIGPLLLEKVSDNSGIKDLILKKSKREEMKQDLKEVEEELEETANLLKGLLDWKVPDKSDPKTITPHSGERKLGGLLESLGLLAEKGGEYSFKKLGDLKVSDVLNRMLDELDGFPLYVAGVDAKKDKGTRIAITLASQAAELDKNKHFFGLAGMAYNIPIKTVSEGDEEAKEDDAEKDEPTITLGEGDFTDDESILISDDEDEEEEEEEGTPAIVEEKPTDDAKKKKTSTLEIRLHLGKWFDGETLEDNWFRRLLPSVQLTEKIGWKRRVPLPGIRLMPFQRTYDPATKEAKHQLALRGDLLSLGFDFKGTTKDGLTFLKAKKGPLAYFGLGAVEVRLALMFSADRIAYGFGIKLKDLRLSFGPKEKDEEEESSDDIIGGLQDLLADDWAVVPAPPKPEDKTPKTRLSAKKKDKFSISAGYLSPLFEGSHGTLDVQLYDEKGKRSGMVWIPIERRYRAVYLRSIGIGLKGVENVELSKGLEKSAKLTIALTGGLRFPIFELGFIGAKLSFPLVEPRKAEFSLDGLDVSIKLGPAVISGSFLRKGVEYGGSLTIELPKFSIGAMGFYGNLPVLKMDSDSKIVFDLRTGVVRGELLDKLEEKKIIPAATNAVRRGFRPGEWELRDRDDKRYIIVDADGELNVLSSDKTFFVYGMLSAATGGGVRIGPIEFTAIALGFGIHRKVKVPAIEDVAEFPLVAMVMGEGGYQDEDVSGDIRNQLGEAIEDPVDVLESMAKAFPAQRDQHFVCGGVRFTIATTVDCFGLIIVQWGNDFEFSLLGLARFKYPRDVSAKALCYIEMQILMSIKPGEGTFKLEALLTSNSWIINQDCKVTGGFALYVWFAGDHKDDFVITLGGYHPRFRRPDHYPSVPRLGLNWPVNKNLSIKGGSYMAVTPSCFMLGAKMEASFHSGRISAWFTAYLDVVVAWSPFHYEVDLGISLRVEAALFLFTLKVTISASLQIWGPPVGGIARIDLTVVSFDIAFGTPREQAKIELIKSWEEFCRSFLKASGASQKAIGKPVDGPQFIRMNLVSGRNNLNAPPISREALESSPPETRREPVIWKVRGDELVLAASTAVPVSALNLAGVKTNSELEGVQERGCAGKSLLVPKPVVLKTDKPQVKNYAGKLGVHPMGKKLQSVLNVTIVRDDDAGPQPDLKEWTIEEDTTSLPAALWDTAKPNVKGPSEPTAKLIPNCITGIKSLRPPAGKRGQRAAPAEKGWQPLDPAHVPKSGGSLEFPAKTRSRSVQAAVAGKQAEHGLMVDALAKAGFKLAWRPARVEVCFRELQAEPLIGEVATK